MMSFVVFLLLIFFCRRCRRQMLRGESPEEKRQRLRNERRAKKKAGDSGPDVTRSDVQVDVTSTMLKLSLRNQAVIAGPLFKNVDPEGCNWQIDNPGPGQPKEVTITLLKAEPAKSREMWWRVPLKGLENRAPARRPSQQQPADPEMVRKAIEAIKAKSAAGSGAKLGAKGVPAATAGGQGGAAAAAAAASASAGAAPVARNGTAAPSTTTPGAEG
ncbi:unnamed protein product, partial [Laminaria digitata]